MESTPLHSTVSSTMWTTGYQDLARSAQIIAASQRGTRAEVSSGSMDEIATAIARCAGCLADSVATGESIDGGEGRAIHYGGISKIFFGR